MSKKSRKFFNLFLVILMVFSFALNVKAEELTIESVQNIDTNVNELFKNPISNGDVNLNNILKDDSAVVVTEENIITQNEDIDISTKLSDDLQGNDSSENIFR